jgi:uncharacterized DUF497 family protein
MMRFDWDEEKAASNLAKHEVSFTESATVLADPLGWSYPDLEHSDTEERWITVGLSERQRVLVVAHTAVADSVRIISGRQATRRERRFYEER